MEMECQVLVALATHKHCNGRALDRVTKQSHRPNRQKSSNKCPKIVVFSTFGQFWDIFPNICSTFFRHSLFLGCPTIFRQIPRKYRKHARAFMRTLAKPGEVWRTLANPQRHSRENIPDIHQSSGEGLPRSPEFQRRCLLYEGGLQNVSNDLPVITQTSHSQLPTCSAVFW